MGEHFCFCSTAAEHLPKILLGLRDAPGSAPPWSWLLSSAEPSEGLGFSSASFVQLWRVKEKWWAAAGWGEGWQSQGFRGWLSWDRSAGQGYDSSGRPPEHLWVWVLCLLLPRPLVTCLLSPSSLFISFVTLGFHTALRAEEACSVRMRKVFLFLHSLYLCSFLRSVYTTFYPNPFVPSSNYTSFSAL